MLELKQACGSKLYCPKVVYTVTGDQCYFCSVDPRSGNTINKAEETIDAIARQEGLEPLQTQWFDLQTYRGWEGRKPGEYVLDELILQPDESAYGFTVKGWDDRSLPPEILDAFEEWIGAPEPTAGPPSMGGLLYVENAITPRQW